MISKSLVVAAGVIIPASVLNHSLLRGFSDERHQKFPRPNTGKLWEALLCLHKMARWYAGILALGFHSVDSPHVTICRRRRHTANGSPWIPF